MRVGYGKRNIKVEYERNGVPNKCVFSNRKRYGQKWMVDEWMQNEYNKSFSYFVQLEKLKEDQNPTKQADEIGRGHEE